MKMKDIRKEFTAITKAFIDNGYDFSVSMSGHQGEVMKVDLENGKQTVRIRMEKFSNWRANEAGLDIIVESFDTIARDSMCTLWNGKGQRMFSQRYYEIARDFYITDIAEILRINKLRDDRYHMISDGSHEYKYLNSPAARLLVLRYVRRQDGCKTKKPTDILNISRGTNRAGKVYYKILVSKGKGTQEFWIYPRMNPIGE